MLKSDRAKELSIWFAGWMASVDLDFSFFARMQPVHGGVAEEHHIFPLPELPHDEENPLLKTFWKDLANQGIRTFNKISEGVNSSFDKARKSTRAQRRVLSQISSAYHDTYSYGSVRTDVKPYAKENISWPQAASAPVPLENCLSAADSEWLGTWQSHMLRADNQASEDNIVPYTDRVVKNNPKEYCAFLHEPSKRNMIKYRLANGEKGKLGVFFVAKKSGQLRLIFDTRLLNQAFHDPPSTDLPSAGSFTRLEVPEGSQFYIASGDLSIAFYTLQVPPELREMFTLPAAQAGTLGILTIDGISVEPSTQILPYLTVLPMGWSWALHLCQTVLMHGIRSAGFPEYCIIGDKRLPVHVQGSTGVGVAGYVDNFGVFGSSKQHVDQGLRRMTVHEEEEASLTGDFVGLHFNVATGYVSIKPSRLNKIKAGIDDLLRRQFCTGRTLQIV